MNAFIDARCPCGENVGWFGSIRNRLSCTACGYLPPVTDEVLLAELRNACEVPSYMMAAVGLTLRQYRLCAGVSLCEPADALGVAISQVSRWERGDGEPTPEQRAALLALYGVPAEAGGS